MCVGRNPPAMLRIVVKPIYIRFYDEFPFLSFGCSVRVCYVALWMVWVVLLYNSLHSIAVQQAQEVTRICVYLDLEGFFFFGLLVAFSLFSSPPPNPFISQKRSLLPCIDIVFVFLFLFSFFLLFLLSLLISSVEIICFENIRSLSNY